MSVLPETKNYYEYSGFCSPSTCLHVGNLKKGITKKDLIDHFSVYAPVKSIRIKYLRSRLFIISLRIERRIAFIELNSIDEAISIKRNTGKSDLWIGNLQFAKTENQ